ncbi:MAG: redoxin domain-containing protein [Halalkalicoccus sp.]|nr:redoxin domain-containing protein [Halalkalicoccus sp.]
MMVEFDVVELGPADHPVAGETAPDFTRPLVNREFWEDVSLSELTDEGAVLLVFTPMDGAFPATYVWNEIRDRSWGESVTVVGLSISTPYEHMDLLEERGIDHALFSDPGADVAREYGIDHDLDGMSGISEPRPAVFLLGENRIVEYAWVAEEWPDFPPYDEIEDAIESL